MRKFFDMDSPVMKALSVTADLLVLNLLTLLCSIPVVTFGAAVTAMHDVTIRIVRGEEGYIFKGFFRAFAGNFKKGTLLGLLLLLCAALLAFDYWAAAAYIPPMRIGIAALAMIVLAAAFYAFALLARYENTFSGTLKNAVTLSIVWFPRTLGMVAFAAVFWLACRYFPAVGAPLLLLFGLALPCYVNALLMKGVFDSLEN